MAVKTTKASPPAKTYANGMDKLRDEMAKDNSCYVRVVGEYLTNYLLDHPEAEAAILAEGKTIKGSLDAMRKEASKQKSGSVAVLDDETGFRIVREYFGLKSEPDVTKKADDVPKTEGNVIKQPVDVPTEAKSDPFDLDVLMGVM